MTTTLMLMCLSSAGCGTTVEATEINDSPKPSRPRRPGQVEIYASSAPSRPHVDVALLTVEQPNEGTEQGTEIMISRLREKAGEMGCDAVFISGQSQRDRAQGGNWAWLDPGSRSIHATCIVYSDDAEGVHEFHRDPTPTSAVTP